MRLLLVIFLMTINFTSAADPQPWMKKNNPNSLGLFSSIGGDCPFSNETLKKRFEGEFLRSRLKVSDELSFNITVNTMCIPITNIAGDKTGTAISYEIRFGTKMPNGSFVLYEIPNYGSLLIGGNGHDSSQFFVNAITNSVADALTDYLKSNFQ